MEETKKAINEKYKINPGIIANINRFKTFIGPKIFDELCNGVPFVSLPLEEEGFKELMGICLDEVPENFYNIVTEEEASEIVGFFCKPFAGKYLKRIKSQLSGLSSLLPEDPKLQKMVMEFIKSMNPNGTGTERFN